LLDPQQEASDVLRFRISCFCSAIYMIWEVIGLIRFADSYLTGTVTICLIYFIAGGGGFIYGWGLIVG